MYRFSAFSIKIPAAFLTEIKEKLVKFKWNQKAGGIIVAKFPSQAKPSQAKLKGRFFAPRQWWWGWSRGNSSRAVALSLQRV